MSIEVRYEPTSAARAMATKLDDKGLAPLARAIGRLRSTSAEVEAEILAAFTASERAAADRARLKAEVQRNRPRVPRA